MERPAADMDATLGELLRELLAGQKRMEDTLGRVAANVSDIEASVSLSPTNSEMPYRVSLRSSQTSTSLARSSPELSPSASGFEGLAEPRPSRPRKPSGPFVAHTLPPGWPATLEPRDLLERIAASELEVSKIASTISPLAKRGKSITGLHVEELRPKESLFRRLLPINPASKISITCDMFSLLVLTWDLTMLPYILAWDVPAEGALAVCLWFTLVFWTLEIPRALVTGIRRGSLRADLRASASNYLRGWCMIDSALVLGDWLSMVLASSVGGSARMLRLAKLSRMLRILGIVRTLRFVRIMETFAWRALSETYSIGIRVLMGVMLFLWLTHAMTCAWFAIGKGQAVEGYGRWTEFEVREGVAFLHSTPLYQYLSAFHWAVAQVTTGNTEIAAFNTLERIFTIVSLFVGLVVSSVFTSLLSAAMVESLEGRKEEMSKLRSLRRFLLENEVGPRLASLVQLQAHQRLRQQVRLAEKDVPLLALLPSSLRVKLRYAIFKPYILAHPLFRLWRRVEKGVVEKLCAGGCEFVHMSAHDDLFTAGSKAEHAYYVVSGSLTYEQDALTSAVQTARKCAISEGDWLSEAALWTKWVHVGTAVAKTHSKVMSLAAKAVIEMSQEFVMIQDMTVEYGGLVHRRLAVDEPLHYPCDLQVPFTDFSELVGSMSQNVQTLISTLALNQLVAQSHVWFGLGHTGLGHAGRGHTDLDWLKGEVEAGQALLVESGEGEILRVVWVALLRIMRGDGRFLAELAAARDGKRQVACRLPGGKLLSGEEVADAAQRLLEARVPELADLVAVTFTEGRVAEQTARQLKTRYHKTIVHAELRGGFDARPLPTLRPAPGAHGDEPGTAHRVLHNKDIFYFASKGGDATLCAFLNEDEFESLGASDAKHGLEEWLHARDCWRASGSPLRPPPGGQNGAGGDEMAGPEGVDLQEELVEDEGGGGGVVLTASCPRQIQGVGAAPLPPRSPPLQPGRGRAGPGPCSCPETWSPQIWRSEAESPSAGDGEQHLAAA